MVARTPNTGGGAIITCPQRSGRSEIHKLLPALPNYLYWAQKAIVHSVLESAVSRYISSFGRNAAGGQMANRIAVGMKIPRFSQLYSVHNTLLTIVARPPEKSVGRELYTSPSRAGITAIGSAVNQSKGSLLQAS